ncbi:hypothetical protein GALMADRAFT_215501 [Galerina marginata CBS 339.88]|uniref:Uncharacterized protein n=1 Tax=Galerina marginata (strain CBS 339.88) TaxID=685588 RepID=A0A067SMM9_GALM3|nr:hypothetical protein GALMADRAFT_215501 [Galerina marginata CBS 339.88]
MHPEVMDYIFRVGVEDLVPIQSLKPSAREPLGETPIAHKYQRLGEGRTRKAITEACRNGRDRKWKQLDLKTVATSTSSKRERIDIRHLSLVLNAVPRQRDSAQSVRGGLQQKLGHGVSNTTSDNRDGYKARVRFRKCVDLVVGTGTSNYISFGRVDESEQK